MGESKNRVKTRQDIDQALRLEREVLVELVEAAQAAQAAQQLRDDAAARARQIRAEAEVGIQQRHDAWREAYRRAREVWSARQITAKVGEQVRPGPQPRRRGHSTAAALGEHAGCGGEREAVPDRADDAGSVATGSTEQAPVTLADS